jgi:hypothetical protein
LVSGRFDDSSFDFDLWVKVLVSEGSLFLVYQNILMLKKWNGFGKWIFFLVGL